jgi:hypothetical protein
MTYIIVFYVGIFFGIILAALMQAAKEGNE